ncbi:hypothetical protein [Pseudoflavonifractor phocaeensis]|uniref:hypothetical protein n=1 Tax=Pseudoflavonifractor phocaeensis TaxID=1870988 RepID=UPI0030B8B1CA
MEVTIHYNGQAVAVEVTLEVYEFLDRADHKAENLSHEQRRHWDGREFDEYIVATEGVGIYRSRRPMIITTNLKLAELKNPPDLAHARIYDRILERCAPILFAGKNFREENAGATRQAAKDIVNRKSD